MMIKVQSDSDPTIEYLVDPVAGTCSCPQGARLAALGSGRVCKHVTRLRDSVPAPGPEGVTDPEVADAAVQGQESARADALALLDRPTVDLEEFRELPSSMALQERTACVLVSAVLREEAAIEALEKRAREEAIAWSDFLRKRQERAKSVRALVRDFMLRTGTTKIQHPDFTISVGKGRKTLNVLDESKALDVCRAVYPAAIRTTESLIVSELRVALDSVPAEFVGLVEEQTGDPTLLVRKRG
jgi:hypothetical protein